MDVASCIIKGDLRKASSKLVIAERIAADDMHTWCNKGKLLLLRNQGMLQVRQAAFKMLELYVNPSLVPRIRFMMDSGYFIAETNREQQDRVKCGEIFRDCLDMIPSSDQPQHLMTLCHFLSVKINVRRLRNRKYHEKWDEECTDALHEAFENLAQLAIANRSPEFNADMWLWLAELQFLERVPKELLRMELDEFKSRTKFEDVTVEKCLETVAKIKQHHESEIDCKVIARLGRLCMLLAYRFKDPETSFDNRAYWSEQAYDHSQYFIQNYYWIFMCGENCAKALLQLWVLHMYRAERQIVQLTFQQTNFKKRLCE